MLHGLNKAKIINFYQKLQRTAWVIVLTAILWINVLPGAAWAGVKYPGSFEVTQPCNATTSISGKNPIALNVNQSYESVELNKENNPSHVYITVPNFGNRWVALSCGNLSKDIATNPIENPIQPPKTGERKFIPFFDNIDNPVRISGGDVEDLSPPEPQLNEFDVAINELCGEVGKVVSEKEFEDTMGKFPNVLANIKNYVGGEIFPGRDSSQEFLDDLTTLWFKALGFDHVFCGEPGSNKIGGLHFAGRYYDLQQKGVAGILASSKNRAEVDPGAVYTLGVELQVGERIIKDPMKGYGYTLNAEEILEIGAKAYKDNPSTSTGTQACILTINDDGKKLTNVFVTKNGAIRTFYPDATPDFSRNPPCNQ
ncbi:MAG TPA: EndoU domain-containing protein [Nostocaceae cyanobacterium]|nr:EndoU domain-containing protein [Nostocaceae cyanobacterium]